MRLTPRDLYRLRRTRLLAQRAVLRAQFAQQQLQEVALDLERRYGLLSKEAVLDIHTGAITEPASSDGLQDGSDAQDAGEEVSREPANDAGFRPS